MSATLQDELVAAAPRGCKAISLHWSQVGDPDNGGWVFFSANMPTDGKCISDNGKTLAEAIYKTRDKFNAYVGNDDAADAEFGPHFTRVSA